MRITVDNATMMAEVKSRIDEGFEVRLRAKGRSMAPYIRDGKDTLVLSPVTGDVAVGAIVLARVTTGNCVAHRVIAIDGDRITLKGDGNVRGTETTTRADIIAEVTHIERNGRLIDCRTRLQRLKAAVMHAGFLLRHYAGAPLRRARKLLSC